MRIARTTGELAAQLGTTRRTITAWLKRSDSPGRTAAGGFNVGKWRDWMQTSGVGARTLSADSDPRLLELRKEMMCCQVARQKEATRALTLQNSVARGELVRMDEAKQVIGTAYSSMMLQLRQMKHRVSAVVCGQDSGTASRILAEDMARTLAAFSIPEGLSRHPFFGELKTQLDLLHSELREAGL